MSDTAQPKDEGTEASRSSPPTMDREKIQRFVGEFAERRRARLIKRFTRMGETQQDAEDLVHEALVRFVHAFNAVESLPSETSCAAWLSTTVANLYRDLLRRRRTRRKALPLLFQEEAAPELDESTQEALTEKKKQLAEAISQLPPAARAAIELEVDGKSDQDIARQLGIRAGAVRKRLHDARRKLTTYLRRFRAPGGH